MPESWNVEALSRHVELISGQHIEAALCNEEGLGTPYLTGPADFPAGEVIVTKFTQFPKVLCEPGDLLITVKGSGTGKTTDARDTYCISRQLMAVRPTSMNGGYLRHVLAAQTARMRAEALGFIPGIGRGDVLAMPVGSPPLPEQRQIAEILDTIDEAIRKTEEIIAKLKQVKQGLLHDLLTRGIDDNGELRDPVRHPDQFKDSPLGRIPKEWKVSRLADTASVTVGYVGPTNPYYTDENRGVLFLRTGNIKASGIDLADVRWVTEAFHRSQPKSALAAEDVVVSRVGYTGTAAVVPELGQVNCANMIIIRAGVLLEPQWVRRLFEADVFTRQVLGFTAGSAQPVLNIRLVERLTTPLPPHDEQRGIGEILAQHEKRLASVQVEVAKLGLLKQGLMEDLLTGQVRVTPLLRKAAA